MLTVTHYIDFLNAEAGPLGTPQRYQGYFPGETRTLNGLAYQFAPFSIAGDVSTNGTQNGDYELIAVANTLTGSLLWQAAESRYFIKIHTVLLAGTPPATASGVPTYSEIDILSSTISVCDSFAYTDSVPGEEDGFSAVTLRLGCPFNFVTSIAPTRRLTAAQVGPLPSSGGIGF